MPLAVLLAWLVLLRRGHDPRKALLLSTGFVAAFAVVLTEVLSLLTLVIPAAAAAAWAGLNLALAVTLIPGVPGGKAPWRGPDAADLARGVHPGLVGGALLLWGIVLVLGGIGPSNTPDVMTYHLPRVMHWVQNGTVAFYPTWVGRQLYMPPGAEYLLLQFVLLGAPGTVSLLQGVLLGVGALGASLVVERLGGGSLPQTLGALLVLTLPMGLLQGMTAQNDLVLSVWFLGLTALTWEVTGAESARPEDRLGWGVFLGLAALTKGTAYVYGVPIVLTVAFVLAGRHRGGLVRTIPLLLAPLVLTAGHFVRVEGTFGHPLGSRSVRNLYANGTADPRAVGSNVLRNLTLQLNTPSREANRVVEAGVERLHRWMGFSPEDPRTTWPGTAYRVTRTVPNQDRASNPLHLILLLLVLAGLAARARRAPPSHRLMGLGLVAGFVLFCAVLKWQPWHARLHLPLFVVGAPLVAARLEGVLGRRGGILLGALLLIQGGILLTVNQVHPVIGEGNVWTANRHERRFLKRPSVRGAYHRLAVSLRDRSCGQIGLVWRETAYEYPLWAMLDAVEIHHVAPPGVPRRGFVEPKTSPSPRAGSGVCLWVCRGQGRCEDLGGSATRVDRFGPYSVWRPRDVDPSGFSDAGGSHRWSRIRSAASSRSSPLTRRSKSPTSATERR